MFELSPLDTAANAPARSMPASISTRRSNPTPTTCWPWKSLPIAMTPGPKVPFHQRWDLLQQGLRAGDMVTTKIVATDLKGNFGESRPIQISITAAGFEMKRITALNAQRALAEALRAWREGAVPLHEYPAGSDGPSPPSG